MDQHVFVDSHIEKLTRLPLDLQYSLPYNSS